MIENGQPQPPYTKGWVAPWRGQWGPLHDGHSKLGKLRKKALAQLTKQCRPQTEDQQDAIGDAADLLAMARMMSQQLGRDPKATPRKVSSMHKAVASIMGRVSRSANTGQPISLADALRAMPDATDEASDG